MYRSLISATMLLFSTVGSSGEAEANCPASETTYLQCSFSVPEMSDGESSVFINTNTDDFAGATAVSCKAGTLTHSQQACAPAVESNCSLNTSAWYGSGGDRCEHDQQGAVLVDGASKTLNSTTTSGSISYLCKNGALSVTDSNCGVEKMQSASAEIEMTASATVATRSETVYVTTTFVLDSQISNMNSPVLISESEIACGNLAGSDIGTSDIDIEYVGPLSGRYQYNAHCPFTVDGLECDEILLNDFVSGTYSNQTNEYSNSPGHDEYQAACVQARATSFERIIYSERFNPGNNVTAVDLYEIVAVCSGAQSACGATYDSNPLPEMGPAISCDSAYVNTGNEGYIAVTGGSSVTSQQVLEGLCEPMGFNTLESFDSSLSSLLTSSGDVAYYNIEAICSTYKNGDTAPLMSSCSTDDVAANPDVTVLTCDAASVKGNFRNSILNSQGDGIVESRLCVQNSYDQLDSWAITGSVDSSIAVVTAQCSGYSGTAVIDGCGNEQCIGDEIFDADTLYSTIEVDGRTYIDLCAEESEVGCESCTVGNFSFTDTNTGNSCTISVDETFSGSETHYDFFENGVNGKVDVLCNNGGTTLVDGGDAVCYKSCPGNVTIGWDDSNGAQSCSNTVPSGNYAHGDTVNLNSSLTNTGSASLRCDGYTGSWVIESASCLLDCNETALWGSGTSASGVSKRNLCRASSGRVSHGATGSLESITTNTSGSSNYRCDNGDLKLSNESCNVDCSTESKSWGSYCGTTVSSLDHGRSRNVSHTKSTSYLYDSSISGSARFSCNDGELDEVSSSCGYITGTTNGVWTGWSETGRSCTLTPDSEDYEPGDFFTQTSTCDVDFSRSRAKYYVWNDGSRTQYDTEYDYKEEIETSQQSVEGTGAPQRDFLGNVWGDWGAWRKYSEICYNRICTDYFVRYRDEYATYDMVPTSVPTGRQQRDDKSEERESGRVVTGTSWGEFTDWTQSGIEVCEETSTEITCTTEFSRFRCLITYYSIAPSPETDCGNRDYEFYEEEVVTAKEAPVPTPSPITPVTPVTPVTPTEDLQWVTKDAVGCVDSTNVSLVAKGYDESMTWNEAKFGSYESGIEFLSCSNTGDTALIVIGTCSLPPTTRYMLGAAVCEDTLEYIDLPPPSKQ